MKADEEERYKRVSRQFKLLMEVMFKSESYFLTHLNFQGRHEAASLRAPDSPPDWLDHGAQEACRRGQEVYMDNLYANMAGGMDALLIGMCIHNFYRPLVYSQKTVKRPQSGMRYMETGMMMYSWYRDDLWARDSVSIRAMRRVNAMHRHVADKVRPIVDSLEEEVEKIFRENDIDCEERMTDQDKILLSDIEAIKARTQLPQEYLDYVRDSTPFSELDMAIIQGAFFAPYLMYPRHYGVSGVSRGELQDFVALWRVFGFYLGIDEMYNAVPSNFDFDDMALYCDFLMEKILKPCMLHLDARAIYMAKTAVMITDYNVVAYAKYRLVGYDLPNLWMSFSLKQKLLYYFRQIYLPYFYPLPGVKQVINYFTKSVLGKVFSMIDKKYKIGIMCPVRHAANVVS